MFFSVKRALKIAGKIYIPCICYPVTKFLERTVNKLSDEGKAVIYEDRVFFQNGKVIEKEAEPIKRAWAIEKPRKEKKEKTNEEIFEKSVVKENLTTESPKKDRKKAKAEAEVKPEADETEGF